MRRAAGWRVFRVPALLAALLIASGCGGADAPETGDGGSDRPRVARGDAAYDPAMAGRVVEPGSPEDEDQAAAPASKEPSMMEEAEGLTVDRGGCRVFLPGQGWVGIARFWDIYYNEPDLLPGSFDHNPLKDIALEGFEGEPGPGLACIGVEDHRE